MLSGDEWVPFRVPPSQAITTTLAQVLCRSLGLAADSGQLSTTSAFHENVQAALLNCDGSELAVSDCWDRTPYTGTLRSLHLSCPAVRLVGSGYSSDKVRALRRAALG